MTDTLKVEYVPLDDSVQLWQRNPKSHDLGALIRSFERHGFKQPPRYEPTLNNGAGGIVAGNGRIEALMAMRNAGHDAPRGIEVRDGTWYVPVLFGVDAASQAAAEAFGLDDNNLTLLAGDFTAIDASRMWNANYLELLTELANQDELPVSVDGDDLDALLAYNAPEPEALDDEPVAVDETKPTRCQPGDVWQVGRHIVACLDSTDAASIERLVHGRRVGMVVADPPYGIDIVPTSGLVGNHAPFGSTGKGASKRADAIRATVYDPVVNDESIETAKQASELCLSLYPDAFQLWWGANNYAHILPPSMCWIVWDKENTGNFADAELAWTNHDGAVRIFAHEWNGMLRASERGKRVHPTQKPIAFYEWLYEKYGSTGDLIVDPFLGSGPSLKAAEVSDRTVVGCELSPHYIDHILDWACARGLPVERVEHPIVVETPHGMRS